VLAKAHWPPKGNVFGHFFYANASAPCVGTAVIYLDFNKNICKDQLRATLARVPR
jgi:hypothetical protein